MTLILSHFNTWGACLFHEECLDYYDFLCSHAQKCDVLHLSEVHYSTHASVPAFIMPNDSGHRPGPIHTQQLQAIQDRLSRTHEIHFAAQLRGLHDCDKDYPQIKYGNVTLVKKDLVYDIQSRIIYREFNQHNNQVTESDGSVRGYPASKSGHSIMIFKNETWYQSVHMHGHWDIRGKVDTKERVEQFAGMMRFALEHRKGKHQWQSAKLIVGGDFNITSDCKVLEQLRNSMQFGEGKGTILNHKFGVTNTRTSWYPEDKPSREANFVIVSDCVKVLRFEIDDQAPSDHALLTTVTE